MIAELFDNVGRICLASESSGIAAPNHRPAVMRPDPTSKSRSKDPEVVLNRLREDLKDLFPDMAAHEIEGVLMKVMIYARQEKGLSDMPSEQN